MKSKIELLGYSVEARDVAFTGAKEPRPILTRTGVLTQEWSVVIYASLPRFSVGEVPSLNESQPFRTAFGEFVTYEGAQAIGYTFLAQNIERHPCLEVRVVRYALQLDISIEPGEAVNLVSRATK